MHEVFEGVNALERAIIISTDAAMSDLPFEDGCQCPRTGNHHFYTPTRVVAGFPAGAGVNALERAIIISTN